MNAELSKTIFFGILILFIGICLGFVANFMPIETIHIIQNSDVEKDVSIKIVCSSIDQKNYFDRFNKLERCVPIICDLYVERMNQ